MNKKRLNQFIFIYIYRFKKKKLRITKNFTIDNFILYAMIIKIIIVFFHDAKRTLLMAAALFPETEIQESSDTGTGE